MTTAQTKSKTTDFDTLRDGDTIDGYAEPVSVFGVYRRMPLDVSNVHESVGDIDLEAL